MKLRTTIFISLLFSYAGITNAAVANEANTLSSTCASAKGSLSCPKPLNKKGYDHYVQHSRGNAMQAPNNSSTKSQGKNSSAANRMSTLNNGDDLVLRKRPGRTMQKPNSSCAMSKALSSNPVQNTTQNQGALVTPRCIKK